MHRRIRSRMILSGDFVFRNRNVKICSRFGKIDSNVIYDRELNKKNFTLAVNFFV